jgi:hypothetical protein
MNAKQRRQDKKSKTALTELARAKARIAELETDVVNYTRANENLVAASDNWHKELTDLKKEHKKLVITEQCVRDALHEKTLIASKLEHDNNELLSRVDSLKDELECAKRQAAEYCEKAKETDKLKRRLREKATNAERAIKNKAAVTAALRIPEPD